MLLSLAGNRLAGIVLLFALASANVSAAILTPFALPHTTSAIGSQSDTGFTEVTQTIVMSAASITSATWWGYYGLNNAVVPSDPLVDSFFSLGTELTFEGTTVFNSFSKTDIGIVSDSSSNQFTLFEYVLDFSSTPFEHAGGDLTIGFSNQNPDVEWFWQGGVDGGQSFRLSGTRRNQAVPEPGSLALVGLALAGLGFLRSRARAPR